MNFLYIDPGIGSIVIQSIIAGILGIVFFVKTYWNKIKEYIFKSKPKIDNEIEE